MIDHIAQVHEYDRDYTAHMPLRDNELGPGDIPVRDTTSQAWGNAFCYLTAVVSVQQLRDPVPEDGDSG